MMKKNYYLIILAALVTLNGCAPLFSTRKNIEIHHEDNVDLELKGIAWKKKKEDNVFRVYNRSDYLVIQNKEGYKSIATPISPHKINPLYVVDIAIPTILFGGTYLGVQVLYLPATLTGLSSLSSLALGPWLVHSKQYFLPQLSKYPQRDTEDKYLMAGRVNINLSPNNIKSSYHKNYRDISNLSDKPILQTNSDDLQRATVLEKELQKNLKKFGYTDTTNIFTHLVYPYRLNLDINGIRENIFNSYYSLGISSKWSIVNGLSDNEIASFTVTSMSSWSFLNRISDQFRLEHLSDAMEFSLIDLFSNSNVSEAIEKEEESFNEKFLNWETIHIKNSLANKTHLSDAKNSSVTIIGSKGHGSGFFISENGYILTCYHVVGDNSDEVEILTSDGVKHKCEIVRTNPYLDISLLKIDIDRSSPIKLSKDIFVKEGTEVYAIGTPRSIELAGTMTRGIVSGTRTAYGRNFVQSDVTINSGNSGGALVDKEGELIGIVNAKLFGISIEGIGFAIPYPDVLEGLRINFEKNFLSSETLTD